MFLVEREYKFTTFEDEGQCIWEGEIVEYEFPIIGVKRSGNQGDIIINTSSSGFISAEVLPYRSPEERAAELAAWEKSLNDIGKF